MAYFGEEMDLDPYETDDYFLKLGLYGDEYGDLTPGQRALAGLPGILREIYGRARELSSNAGGYEDQYGEIEFDPVTGLPVYDPFDPVIFEQTTPVRLDQEVGGGQSGSGGGGGGGAPRRPTSTTVDGSISNTEGSGGGMRPIPTPTGTIFVPEGLNPLQLLTQGLITREIYKQETGEEAPDINQNNQTTQPAVSSNTSEVSDLSDVGLRRSTTVNSIDTSEVSDLSGGGLRKNTPVNSIDTSEVSDLSGGGLRRDMDDEDEEFEDGTELGNFGGQGGSGGQGGQGGSGGSGGSGGQGGTAVGQGGTGEGGQGGSSSIVFNPYQPTLSPYKLGEYGRLIPSTQSGVLPELADFMNYYGASVPGMTQQMANVTGAGQTAYAQQVLGMEGDNISAFDIAQESALQQRGALGDVFGLGPDATYADITAAGTAPMQGLSQVRETVLPGLRSAFEESQQRLRQGLSGRQLQNVEQQARARFGDRLRDNAAFVGEVTDVAAEDAGLFSKNLQDLLGISQTTSNLGQQEAYAMSPFTEAAIASSDLGPGLALAGDIGRQAAAATPSPTDLFGLEAGERQFGLDIEALEAAAKAGDLNVISNMLQAVGSGFRGGPMAGLQQQNLGTPPYFPQQSQAGNPFRYF